jgi:hypothetical protein
VRSPQSQYFSALPHDSPMRLLLVLVLLWLSVVSALWHAYDANKKYDKCSKNASEELRAEFSQRTRAFSLDKRQKWKLWPEVISKRDLADGETMYGFEEGMDAIWQNQHPADCSKAKFLIGGGFESGFGSEIHVLGSGMALAMSLNRVYIMLATNGDSSLMDKMHSNNKFQVDIDFCRKQGKTNLECYYEPWSSCTLEDALQGTTLQTLRMQGLNIAFNDLKKQVRQERTLIVHLSPELVDEIPAPLMPMLHCSPFPPDKYRYWWRSLTAAYIMRPNTATTALIMKHRRDPEMTFDQENEQCVSVYVRRGDKHLEMNIIQDETLFFKQAQEFSKDFKTPSGQPQSHPVMFIGSEDPSVMDSAIAWGKKNDWKVLYSNLFDRRAISTGLNNEQQQAARQAGTFTHHEWEYFTMVLNIDAHIRCSAFVCTHRSNYCRIIDELRATVAHKANRKYADFSCGSPPPCIDSPGTGIDWR